MSLFNPFCKCLNPQRIVNPYTNEAMTVPCGHCKACILAKNSRYAFQCDLESYSSKHTLFITLTYANRFIPCAQFVDSMERPYGHDLVDVERTVIDRLLCRKVRAVAVTDYDGFPPPDRALGNDAYPGLGPLGSHRFRRLLAADEKCQRPRGSGEKNRSRRVSQVRCARFHSSRLSSTGLGGIIVDIACL